MFTGISEYIRGLSNYIKIFVNEAPINAEAKNRLLHYTVFVALGIPTMFVFGIYNLFRSQYFLFTLIFISAGGLSVGWYFLGRLKNGLFIYRINIVVFGFLVVYMLMIGGEGGSKILWMYTYPLIAFFLLGQKEGVFWSGFAFTLALIFFLLPLNRLPVYQYHIQFVIRFITTYLIVSVVAFWFEYLRQKYRTGMEREHQKLEEERDRLQHQIEERLKVQKEKELLIRELEEALSQVKLLSGFLPICSCCKKIRDDNGYWNQIESYIGKHSEAEFSHSICPECKGKLYPELLKM